MYNFLIQLTKPSASERRRSFMGLGGGGEGYSVDFFLVFGEGGREGGRGAAGNLKPVHHSRADFVQPQGGTRV